MPRRRRSLASRADRHELYQVAVQQPEADAAFIERAFRTRYARAPLSIREDFCGTGLVACAWVASRKDRTAFGVDLDPEPLAWGALHNQQALPEGARPRVQLVQADVRTVRLPKCEVVVAGNFSFCVFPTRPGLLGYLRAARRGLQDEGMLVLDVLGGAATQRDETEVVRREKGFVYVWEHKRFDPISYRSQYAIHFRFPDGSELRDAFTYDWRMWTIPELTELLEEAGFASVDVFWEMADVFRRVTRAPADECWLAELVAFTT